MASFGDVAPPNGGTWRLVPLAFGGGCFVAILGAYSVMAVPCCWWEGGQHYWLYHYTSTAHLVPDWTVGNDLIGWLVGWFGLLEKLWSVGKGGKIVKGVLWGCWRSGKIVKVVEVEVGEGVKVVNRVKCWRSWKDC